MAIASKWQAAHFNRPDRELFGFDTYAIAGDGCLMEGVSHEAASIAGHQRLDNLCWIYDNNHITIDGHTDLTYEDRVNERFMGYGWNVTTVGDANDLDEIAHAFENFRSESERPTLIIVDSHIGYGSPHKVDTAEAHGEPLGDDEVIATKKAYGWPEDAEFLVPDGVREHFAEGVGARGAEANGAWKEMFSAYSADEPEARRRTSTRCRSASCPTAGTPRSPASTPTRRASRPARPRTRSRTRSPPRCRGCSPARPTSPARPRSGWTDAAAFEPDDRGGRQFHYGIREHESAAISNGLSLSKLRPLWSTYLTFSDYARPGDPALAR